LNEINVFNNKKVCTPDALYICDIKYFFKWISLYKNTSYVAYVTIPDDALTVVMEDKIKTNKVILHEHLIPLMEFICIAIDSNTFRWSRACGYIDSTFRWASACGHLDVVEHLIKYDIDIHAYNDYALRWASHGGHLAIVEFLIKNDADIHAYDDEALIWASKHGHLAVVECLISHDANIHAGNNSAIIYASNNGHSSVVEYLIKHGATL
jgi:hypothetical protein